MQRKVVCAEETGLCRGIWFMQRKLVYAEETGLCRGNCFGQSNSRMLIASRLSVEDVEKFKVFLKIFKFCFLKKRPIIYLRIL